MQRQINISSHVGPPTNAQTQPMQPGLTHQVGGNTQANLIPMGEWGNRFPAASGSQCPTQTLRPNNSIPMMQSNQMTQQVYLYCHSIPLPYILHILQYTSNIYKKFWHVKSTYCLIVYESKLLESIPRKFCTRFSNFS